MKQLILALVLLVSTSIFAQDITVESNESVKTEAGILKYTVNPEKTLISETFYDCTGVVKAQRVFEVVEFYKDNSTLHVAVHDIDCCDEWIELEFDRMNDEVYVIEDNTLKRISGDGVYVQVYTL